MPDRPIYMDHHATTPCDPRVVEAMLPYFTEYFGNAASIHHPYGREAAAAVDRAREQVAALIGAEHPSEIVFTSGATEANNLALKGATAIGRPATHHLVATAVEHRAVLDPLRRIAREDGHTLTLIPPDRHGRVSPDAVAAALTPQTLLVSVIAANNEIGTLNPIAEIGELCRKRGILLHTDASQAVGKVPIHAPDADLLSLTAHKFHGPKGIGALYIRGKTRLRSLQDGGGHERGLRSGTLPVPLIVGFGTAAEIAAAEQHDEAARLTILRDRLHAQILDRLDGQGVLLNGSTTDRLPGNLHLSFEGVDGEALLMNLHGLAVSSGAACSSAEPGPSRVLHAIGLPEALARASLRFGLGRFSTRDDVDRAAQIVADAVRRLRRPTCDPPPGA